MSFKLEVQRLTVDEEPPIKSGRIYWEDDEVEDEEEEEVLVVWPNMADYRDDTRIINNERDNPLIRAPSVISPQTRREISSFVYNQPIYLTVT